MRLELIQIQQCRAHLHTSPVCPLKRLEERPSDPTDGGSWIDGGSWVYGSPWIDGGSQIHESSGTDGGSEIDEGFGIIGGSWVNKGSQIGGGSWIDGGSQVDRHSSIHGSFGKDKSHMCLCYFKGSCLYSSHKGQSYVFMNYVFCFTTICIKQSNHINFLCL